MRKVNTGSSCLNICYLKMLAEEEKAMLENVKEPEGFSDLSSYMDVRSIVHTVRCCLVAKYIKAEIFHRLTKPERKICAICLRVPLRAEK